MKQNIYSWAIFLTITVLVVCFTIGFNAFGWTEPSIAPPGGNVFPPLNVGSGDQTKLGALTIGSPGNPKSIVDYGVLLVTGNIHWGSTNWRGILGGDQGSSIELGGSGTPYIDFSNNDNPANDYNMRIMLSNNGTALSVLGASGVAGLAQLNVDGSISFTGQKYCSAVCDPCVDKWRDTILVPSTWTIANCRDFASGIGASSYQLGCGNGSAIIRGTNVAGQTPITILIAPTPLPNCGW